MVIFHSYVSLPEGRNCKFLLSKKSCWLALANSGSVTGFQISTLESAGIKNRCCALKSVMPRQRYVVVGGIVGTPGHPLATLPLRMVGGPPLTGKLLPPFGSRVACERKALHPISLWDKCNAAAAENENRNLGRWRLLLLGELADSLKIGTCTVWDYCATEFASRPSQGFCMFLCSLGMKKIKKHQPCHFPLLIWHNSSLRFQPTLQVSLGHSVLHCSWDRYPKTGECETSHPTGW